MTILQACSAQKSTAEGSYDLPLCYPERIVQHFQIEDPPAIAACDTFHAHAPQLSIGDVYAPTSPLKSISAYACTLKTTFYESTNYFFGGKTTRELTSIVGPVSLQRCLNWTQTLSDDKLGPLSRSQDNVNTLESSSSFNPSYVWPLSNTEKKEQAVLIETQLFYNTRTHDFTSSIGKHLRCNATAGYCDSTNYIFTFKGQERTCAQDEEIIQREVKIKLFLEEPHFYIEIPSSGMHFNKLTECPERIISCLTQYSKVLCTNNHYVIGVYSTTFTMPHPLNSSNWEEESFPPESRYRRITQLFANLANEVNNELASLQKQLNRERCLN